MPYLHIIVLIGLIVGATILYFQTLQQNVATNILESEVEQISQNQEKLRSLAVVLPTLAVDTGLWKKTLPVNEVEVALFATELEQLAKAQALVITLNFDDFPQVLDAPGQKMFGLGSDITVEGSFQGFTAFAKALSRMPYFFKVDKLTVIQHDSKVGIKATFSGILMMGQI